MSKRDVHLISQGEEKEEHPRCCQAKGSNDDGELVKGKMVVKFEVLIERKRVGDEEVVVREGVVVISSSLDMLTNSCLGWIMVSLIFSEGLDEEALVEFMVEWWEEDEDDDRSEEDDLFN
uniref:Uncharacterized protein n=1 Tax=Tanacetum cinerariifolium TaxID=118510 RepID=A0A6L2LPE8_TANCI|nr:hypothetical protein [Tanacetum cinerariifolium]